ncbi:peptidoglycan D,D-transpeptidase FtsI family protein [Cellulomonas carbonis]|nr:penicillin-binding protein 2 [Cellulomonas carbonis]GGB97082.1 cell division protein FtsI [Cellulomonas carbonis]
MPSARVASGRATTGTERSSRVRPADRAGAPRRPDGTAAPGSARGPVRTGPARDAARPVRPAPAEGDGSGPRTTPRGPRVGSPPRRQRVALGLVLVLLVVLAGRLVQVQGIAGGSYADLAYSGRLTTVEIPGTRGQVVDRNGEVLASSVERWNVVVNQQQVVAALKTPEKAAEKAAELAELLDMPAGEVGAVLWGGEEKRGFVYLAKNVLPEVYEEVAARRVAGVSGERTSDRSYPAESTGGNVLGFVGADNRGQAGIELVYDDLLSGRAGSQTYEQGARGQRIPTGEQAVEPAVDGHDVQLTIDRDIQYVAQSTLDAKVTESGAEWGALEIVDVRTGEILALVDSGAVDPNDPGATPTDDRGSRSVGAVYEPGSTAKVITMAAALEQGVATPTSQYVVPYLLDLPNIGGKPFKDSHEHGDLRLTLTGILAESSNTGTVMVGKELPRQVRHDYLSKFGFGSTTGVELPGESGGLLWAADDWDGRSQYAVLFGQAVSSTVLQNTQVFATLGNGGVQMQPHLVRGTTAPDGTFTPSELAEPERVVSEETARTVVRMLESAVVEGTGSNGAVPGYRVAGKTGTAQAFEGGGVIKHVSSFIGLVPADDPQLAINVVLYDPKTSIYGGAVAAPVFSQVAAFSLQHLGIPPSGAPAELFPSTWE